MEPPLISFTRTITGTPLTAPASSYYDCLVIACCPKRLLFLLGGPAAPAQGLTQPAALGPPAVPTLSIRWHKMHVTGPVDSGHQGHLWVYFSSAACKQGLLQKNLISSQTGKLRPREGEDLPEATQQINLRFSAPSPCPKLCGVGCPPHPALVDPGLPAASAGGLAELRPPPGAGRLKSCWACCP